MKEEDKNVVSQDSRSNSKKAAGSNNVETFHLLESGNDRNKNASSSFRSVAYFTCKKESTKQYKKVLIDVPDTLWPSITS